MLPIYQGMLERDEERERFTVFYKEHQGKCLAVARAITKNYAWAEEATQDAFLRMIRYKDTYFDDPSKRAGTHIIMMVKCTSIDILRHEKRLDHTSLDDVEPIIANNEPDGLRIVIGKDTVRRLRYHISQLDATSKSLYEMKYVVTILSHRMGSTNQSLQPITLKQRNKQLNPSINPASSLLYRCIFYVFPALGGENKG